MAKKRASKKGCKCPKKFDGKKVRRNKRGSCYVKKANGQHRFVSKVCKGKRSKKRGKRRSKRR